MFAFDNSYARLPDRLFTRLDPTPVAEPRLIAFNDALAAELGITKPNNETLANIFSGNEIPDGAEPLAQLYAGHQFGHWNPQLGDGRAILLGEVAGRDIQLKGSGRTPYSRMGDGRAWLGPVLREYVVSEAMHALGIPTTRALAAVTTGEPVFREAELPGAILTRVAASHIRVGTFQILAARQDIEGLQALTDHAIARHYPDADGPHGLLTAVVKAQAQLIAAWMSVGFIHGVMNTDNCAISGETIDYGPCAFMDDYHPQTVFSSIDQMGRYAYANQPQIAVWNLAQFATALLPLMPDQDAAIEDFTALVNGFADHYQAAWLRRFGAKIGISDPGPDDAELIGRLLSWMVETRADFTNTFRALDSVDLPAEWQKDWQDRLASEPDPAATTAAANPAIIPRNHRIEAMIAAALDGDFAPFHALNEALSRPYEDPEDRTLKAPPEPEEVVQATFCGT
ncbi:protein adenylyltransferase SelO [Aestuariibius sp. 2305UL40-4]|uniref:protein adenylyltransferase SelO n=1 Tax=Aestuariibius violaceus TaxID=3234132 RepID=UPI00345E7E76